MISLSLIYLIMMLGMAFLYKFVPQNYKKYWLVLGGVGLVLSFAPRLMLYILLSVLLNGAFYYVSDKALIKRKWYLGLGVGANIMGFAAYHFSMPLIGVENGYFFISLGAFFILLQNLSYLIEKQQGHLKTSEQFSDYLLYILFFPKVLVGPVQNPVTFLRQFQSPQKLKPHDLSEGLSLVLWGVFQKIAIADRLGTLVNAVFSNPGQHFGIELMLASLCFFIQIYCDYCAFVDISVGCSRIMNIKLEHHFNMPFYMNKERHFWRNYHRPLTQWVETYLLSLVGEKSHKVKGQGSAVNLGYYVKETLGILLGILVLALIRCSTFDNMVLYLSNLFIKIPNGLQFGKLCLDLGMESLDVLKVIAALIVFLFIGSWYNMRKKSYPEVIYAFRKIEFWTIIEINFVIITFLLLGVFKQSYFIYAF